MAAGEPPSGDGGRRNRMNRITRTIYTVAITPDAQSDVMAAFLLCPTPPQTRPSVTSAALVSYWLQRFLYSLASAQSILKVGQCAPYNQPRLLHQLVICCRSDITMLLCLLPAKSPHFKTQPCHLSSPDFKVLLRYKAHSMNFPHWEERHSWPGTDLESPATSWCAIRRTGTYAIRRPSSAPHMVFSIQAMAL